MTDWAKGRSIANTAMMAVYEFMHKRFMEKAEKVLNLQNMFRK